MSIPVFVVHCERISKRAFYYVSFEPNDQLTGRIKELPEDMRKWNSSHRAWEVSTIGLLRIIKIYRGSTKIRFDFGSLEARNLFAKQIQKIEAAEAERERKLKELQENKENWSNYKLELEKNYEQYSDLVHSYLIDGIKLYPHQIIASLFLNRAKNALISHEMGTGKSLTSILYAEMNDYKKVIVVTPNSLKFNYFNEVDKFTNSKAYIINKKKNKYTIEESKYIIFNYEYFNPSNKVKFNNKWKKLNINKIDALIFDEAQALKNTSSNTYKNIKALFNDDIFTDKKVSRVFLSGTPAPNRAHELYSVLNLISPLDFPTKKYFNEYYCGMTYDIYNGWGWVNGSAESKLEELYHKIAPFTHRVLKKNVLKDLPDKTYQRLIMEMEDIDQKTYEEVEKGVVNDFLSNPTSNPLTIMLRLRQYTASLKAKQISELVDTILETGDKIVIVDVFKDTLNALKEKYGDIACLHTGDFTPEQRADMVADFQNPNGKCKIFLGSIQTCNYGLTLTAASKMIILTLPFSVGQYDQVSDRIHRIGQKDAVNIYIPIFEETIDDYVYSTIESKRKEITKVMDNVDYESNIEESVARDVINLIKNKYR